ncbi:MAG: hypothetical protein IT495_18255 [Gammaproteobacteria bacterium]|nr:hypothetical protein [Gammaproteobacteria bacterium]
MPDRRNHGRGAWPVAVAALLLAAVPARGDELVRLGEQKLSCEADHFRVIGTPSRLIPPGKYEWVSVTVPSDVVRYECGLTRRIVVCPIDTTLVKVKRAVSPGAFLVQCYGEPTVLPLFEPVDGEPGDGAGAAGAAPPAGGAPE